MGRCGMRQASRLPLLSLRDCQQINRSSQPSNSPPIEPIFSITSPNLCFPGSGLSLCLCPMNARFIFTVIKFPSLRMITWPGSTELSPQRKFLSSPNPLQLSLCIVIFCAWCSNLDGMTGSRGWQWGSTVPPQLPLLNSDVTHTPCVGCFSC